MTPEDFSDHASKTASAARQEPPPAISISQMTVLEDLVRQLEEIVREARQMPLSSSAIIDRRGVLEIIGSLKGSIPEEVARARAVLRDRDAILDAAQAEAERMVERARERRDQMLERSEIVQAATRAAERMLEEAEIEGSRMRAEVEDYIDSKLANFEIALQKTMATVERGRERLAGRTQTDQLAPEAGEEQPDLGQAP